MKLLKTSAAQRKNAKYLLHGHTSGSPYALRYSSKLVHPHWSSRHEASTSALHSFARAIRVGLRATNEAAAAAAAGVDADADADANADDAEDDDEEEDANMNFDFSPPPTDTTEAPDAADPRLEFELCKPRLTTELPVAPWPGGMEKDDAAMCIDSSMERRSRSSPEDDAATAERTVRRRPATISPCPLLCPLLVLALNGTGDGPTLPNCSADDESADDESERLGVGVADAANEKSPLLAARGLPARPAPAPLRCVCCQDEGGSMEDDET